MPWIAMAISLLIAQAAPGTSPAPAELTDECPVSIVAIVPVPSTGDGSSKTGAFEAILSSPTGPGTTSGTLWINASRKPYRVRFTNRSVLSSKMEGKPDPIIFRLPEDRVVESAFIDSLDFPTPGPCKIGALWTPLTRPLAPAMLVRFQAANSSEPIAAEPIADPAAACHVPDAPAKRLEFIKPVGRRLPIARGISGEVEVSVDLNRYGEIENTRVTKSPNGALNAPATALALQFKYQTAVHACEPVAATYLFVNQINMRK